MTDRRSIPELRAHADKVPGYGHLVAHEMVDEIEEYRNLPAVEKFKNLSIVDWSDVAEYRLGVMRSTRKDLKELYLSAADMRLKIFELQKKRNDAWLTSTTSA
jgi:hypothetical protein